MYVKPCWQPHSEEEIYSLIAEHPWALVVNNGVSGPFATNLPLLVDRSQGERGVLVGHIACANLHADVMLKEDGLALAVFHGSYTYVTAGWYPERDMPSTYYYTAVHCYGRVRIQSEKELHHWVEVLTSRMEDPIPNGWKTTEIPQSEITRRLPAIMGFEIEIERLEGKFKLGQDEPKRDALAVADRLEPRDCDANSQLAEMIRKHNVPRREGE
jgi:transcriptional regulator